MIFLPEKMTAGFVQEQNLQKQMGCMAGFLQIFDRHHHLTGKSFCSAKTLPSSQVTESPPPPPPPPPGKNTVLSEVVTPPADRSMPSEARSPARACSTPAENTPKSPRRLPVFDFKEGTRSPWKFSKEAPRLSLDSRAMFDAKGNLKPREIRTNPGYLAAKDGIDEAEKQRRSPSVIARLMGLEPLPGSESEVEPVAKAELRRSTSESRVSKDLFLYRFIDEVDLQLKQNAKTNSQSNIPSSFIREKGERYDKKANSRESIARRAKTEQLRATEKGIRSRKCFFDSADFFPEPKQTVSLYGEIEKRLKLRGIDEPSKDLETLKQILDAVQLKGLLHSKRSSNQTNSSIVYQESPIVVIEPTKDPGTATRLGNDSPPQAYKSRYRSLRNVSPAGDPLPEGSPRRDASSRNKRLISRTTSEVSVRSPIRRKPLNVESPRSGRASPVQSPKLPTRGTEFDHTANRSPRGKKATAGINQKVQKPLGAAEEELLCASESSVSTNSQNESEAKRGQEGRHLLERCDKLLKSIEDMTTPELQPSPVSVLDESFYKEDESPSPIIKRQVDFKEQLVESEDDEFMSLATVASEDKLGSDFVYVSHVLRASTFSSDDSDVFLLLEKQQYFRGKDTSQRSTLERRLIFDTISEIIYQKRQLPPWKVSSSGEQALLQQVWSEFQKIRGTGTSGDLFEVICSVLRKDLAGDATNSWEDCPLEMSEAVLCIERLVFKDLITETIQLAALSGKHYGGATKVAMPRRRLVF